MTDYIPALISLAGGLLAFFFAKSGERNKVNGAGWAMAALLVGGGVLGLYVIYAKNAAAEAARALAAEEADKAAVFAAKQSALVTTLIGDFDLKQTIPSLNLIFEHPYEETGGPAIAPGFTGPLPRLPDGAVGQFELAIADSYYSARFRTDGPGRIALSPDGDGAPSVFTDEGIEIPAADTEGPTAQWGAGPEPAPSGFVYALPLDVNVQLRRLLYGIVAQPSLGSLRFRKGVLGEDRLKAIEQGLSANPPMLAFYISETEDGEPCDSYVHVPLRFVRSKEPVMIDEASYDEFELRLTPNGFTPDPCNNNPF